MSYITPLLKYRCFLGNPFTLTGATTLSEGFSFSIGWEVGGAYRPYAISRIHHSVGLLPLVSGVGKCWVSEKYKTAWGKAVMV